MSRDEQSIESHLEKCAAQIRNWEASRDYCLEVAATYDQDIRDLKRWVNSITHIGVEKDHETLQAAATKRSEAWKNKK